MTATMNPTKPAQTKIPPAQPPPTNQVFTVPKALTAATVGQFLNSPFILDQIAKALPTHLKPERMIRMAVTLVRRTPALLECDPMTLVACIVQASELGLELSGPLGQAYMIPRRNKGKQECTFQIGYRGFIKLAYNTGQVAFYNARAVFAGDYFAYELGTEQYIKHRREAPPQAKITHFYAVLRQHNGAADCEVWSVGDVEAHRDRFRSDRFLKEKNKSYQGPWDTDFEAMGCKTLIRELAKRAPLSPELMSQAARDEYIERNEVAGRGTGGRLRWAEWGNDRGAGPGVAQGTARHAGCWGMNPRGSTARCRGTLAGGDTDPAAVGLNHERARSCWPCNFRSGN